MNIDSLPFYHVGTPILKLKSDDGQESFGNNKENIAPLKVAKVGGPFQLSDKLTHLSKKQKDKISSKCLKAYQTAVRLYEKCAAKLFHNDPGAKAFAKEMSTRLSKIVEAYAKIMEEDCPSFTRSSLKREVMAELKQKIIFGKVFGSFSTSTGSVGFNPFVIKQVIEEGTLREQLTLCYSSVFSFLIEDVLSNKTIIEKVNQKLNERRAGFQLNVELIEKERSTIGRMLKPSGRVTLFKEKENGRIKKPSYSSDQHKGAKLSEIPGLSLREARVTCEDFSITEEEFCAMQKGEPQGKALAERRVQWVSGHDLYLVDSNSEYAKTTLSLGLGPSSLIAGPSGTTDGFLHAAQYLGLENWVQEGTKACIAWMVPAKDHSLHEILLSGSDYGVHYQGYPEDFERCFDFEATRQLRAHLTDKQMPAYFFSHEYQEKVARDLEFS